MAIKRRGVLIIILLRGKEVRAKVSEGDEDKEREESRVETVVLVLEAGIWRRRAIAQMPNSTCCYYLCCSLLQFFQSFSRMVMDKIRAPIQSLCLVWVLKFPKTQKTRAYGQLVRFAHESLRFLASRTACFFYEPTPMQH